MPLTKYVVGFGGNDDIQLASTPTIATPNALSIQLFGACSLTVAAPTNGREPLNQAPILRPIRLRLQEGAHVGRPRRTRQVAVENHFGDRRGDVKRALQDPRHRRIDEAQVQILRRNQAGQRCAACRNTSSVTRRASVAYTAMPTPG